MIETDIHGLTREAYDADPCDAPSLSATVAKELLNKSPLHAWYMHPRLNPGYQREDPTKFDVGKVAHALMLQDASAVLEIIDADDWRTKAAKDQRDAALKAGKIPVLFEKYEKARAMVAAGRAQLETHEARGAFENGHAEQTLIWQEAGGVWCRSRLDWLPDQIREGMVLYDYKTTDASAHPDAWTRTMYGMGADIQAAFYLRGLRKTAGIERARFRFVVQEVSAPYALSVIELEPASIAMAERKVETAFALWGRCLRDNSWPGYPRRVAHVTAPPWEERAWLEREERDKHGTAEERKLAMEMQRP